MNTILIAILCIASGHTYFTYSDCNLECQQLSVSCTIAEIDPDDFLNVCIESEAVCEQRSSEIQVCLRKNKPPIGGEQIWNDFERHYHPTTTTPRPIIKTNCLEWKIATGVMISIIIFIVCLYMSKKYLTNNTYEVVNDNSDNPYQSTVDNIEENMSD